MAQNQDQQILLVKSFTRGWEFPGGFVERGESLKTAAIREVKEESGMDVQIIGFYGIDQNLAHSTCVIIFQGIIIGGNLTHSDENEGVGFFTIEEALRIITHKEFNKRILRCLNSHEHPFIYELE